MELVGEALMSVCSLTHKAGRNPEARKLGAYVLSEKLSMMGLCAILESSV